MNFRAPERTTAREGGEGCCTQDDSAHSPERPIITRSFTEMPLGSIYVFGAAIGNSSWNKTFDQIKVYSMIDAHAYPDLTEDIKCCVIYGHGESEHVFEASPLTIINHFAKTDIRAFYTTCLNAKHRNRHIPLAVGLTMNGVPCVRDSSSYVKPFVPLKEPGTKLALGTQLAFGNISAEMIIEWMEAYRSLGVDKVVTFYHKSLNENALRVLKYYHESEFLDLYYFEPAAEGGIHRGFHISAHVLSNLLNELGKRDKMRGLPSILPFLAMSFINSIIQEQEC